MSCDHALQLAEKLLRFTKPSQIKALVQNYEFVACVHILTTLRKLHAASCSTTVGNPPRSINSQLNSLLNFEPLLSLAIGDDQDDISVFTNQLAEVWQMASCYAARPADSETPPPWTPESDYSLVM